MKSEEIRKMLGAEAFKHWMHTINGDEIKAGLMVFTYDWKWGKVDGVDFAFRMEHIKTYVVGQCHLATSNDFWFRVIYPNGSHNIYNGERMTTTCPNCHGDFEACNRSGCGQRKDAYWTGWKDEDQFPITDDVINALNRAEGVQ